MACKEKYPISSALGSMPFARRIWRTCSVAFYARGYHPRLLSFPTRRSSDLLRPLRLLHRPPLLARLRVRVVVGVVPGDQAGDRKSRRLNSSHVEISYAVFCLKKKIRARLLPRSEA